MRICSLLSTVPSDVQRDHSCAHAFRTGNLRREDTEGHRESAGAINIFRFQVLHTWRDGVAHFCCRQASREDFGSSKEDVCVLYLFFSLVVDGGDPIENELATLAANIRSFSRNGVEVLSNPDDRFWSALGDTHNPGRGGIPRKQSSVRVWPVGFSREAGRPAQCLKTEMFNVWRGLRHVRHRSGCVQRAVRHVRRLCLGPN